MIRECVLYFNEAVSISPAVSLYFEGCCEGELPAPGLAAAHDPLNLLDVVLLRLDELVQLLLLAQAQGVLHPVQQRQQVLHTLLELCVAVHSQRLQ